MINDYTHLFDFFPWLLWFWSGVVVKFFVFFLFYTEVYSFGSFLIIICENLENSGKTESDVFSLNKICVCWVKCPCKQMRWEGYIQPTWENTFELFTRSFCAQLINGLITNDYNSLSRFGRISCWQHSASYEFVRLASIERDTSISPYKIFTNSEPVQNLTGSSILFPFFKFYCASEPNLPLFKIKPCFLKHKGVFFFPKKNIEHKGWMKVLLVFMEEKQHHSVTGKAHPHPTLPSPRTGAEDSCQTCLVSVQNRLHLHLHFHVSRPIRRPGAGASSFNWWRLNAVWSL